MFIREQIGGYYELRAEWRDEEALDRHVWSPTACRHCCWTFAPNPYGKRLWG